MIAQNYYIQKKKSKGMTETAFHAGLHFAYFVGYP